MTPEQIEACMRILGMGARRTMPIPEHSRHDIADVATFPDNVRGVIVDQWREPRMVDGTHKGWEDLVIIRRNDGNPPETRYVRDMIGLRRPRSLRIRQIVWGDL